MKFTRQFILTQSLLVLINGLPVEFCLKTSLNLFTKTIELCF